MLERSADDVLVMCTDAGVNASMMVFYIGKKEKEGLKLDFVFSIGHLNNDNGVIPRNELDVMAMRTPIRMDDTNNKEEDYDYGCKGSVAMAKE